jgi:hypothetical protein
MFVSDEATLDVGFGVALARLTALAGNAVLTRPASTGPAPVKPGTAWPR